ncbi:MAG: type I glyceraldehyde-3-phosphate dehydrogenase [Saprospiraceae bacterium]|nr:type I glyceraldehyde-3-phosphate dehydrogenase [Saprospiraceae bacterium]
MSKKRIAINGFGRIGRLTFRNLVKDPNVEVVAINDLTDNKTLAHLLKFDTAHGRFDGDVSHSDTHLTVNGNAILATAIKNPAECPWGDLKVDVVLECTGIFTDREKLSLHIKAGAKKVILSAPAKGKDVKTIVLGVNQDEITAEETIYSNASCTTNCLAPVVKVLDQNYKIVQGSMSTIHAYTQDQRLQDSPHSDLRRARAAAQNIVPTSTGAAKAVSLVYPPVGDKISAIAMRVPTITGSLVDLTVLVEHAPENADAVNAKVKEAANSDVMKGILKYSTDPLVSSDVIGDKHSSVFDSELTIVRGNMVRIVTWYDNEAGYSARLAQLATKV